MMSSADAAECLARSHTVLQGERAVGSNEGIWPALVVSVAPSDTGASLPLAQDGRQPSPNEVEPLSAHRDQARTPQAMALRNNAMNASLSHAPRKMGGVVSVGSAVRAARMAGLWQWPRAK